MRRQIGLAEAGEIGRHQMKICGKRRYQVAKHVTGARKSVQQENCRLLSIARLPVIDAETIHIDLPIMNLRHRIVPFL